MAITNQFEQKKSKKILEFSNKIENFEKEKKCRNTCSLLSR